MKLRSSKQTLEPASKLKVKVVVIGFLVCLLGGFGCQGIFPPYSLSRGLGKSGTAEKSGTTEILAYTIEKC